MFKSIQPLAEVLNLEQTSIISGGGSFCTGFGLASGVFAAGVWLNWWYPVGWVGQVVIVGVGIACVINEL